MLGVVVVPGHSVMIQERKELATVLLKPLLVCLGNLGVKVPPGHRLEESFHFASVLAEMPAAEPVPVDRVDHQLEQAAEVGGEGLEFLVKGVGQDIVVEV